MPTTTSDAAILHRLIRPERNDLSVSAARALLKIDFTEEDRVHMRELSRKAQNDDLTTSEKTEIEDYERIGHLLDLIHSKARLALHRSKAPSRRMSVH